MSIARKGLIAALLGAGLAVGASGALAQAQSQDRPGWYVGGAFGQADIGPDDDTAWKLFGGYDINRHFAVEVAYSDLGEVTELGVNTDARAYELSGLLKFPLGNQFSIYGLGGIANVKAETSGPLGTVSDDSTELTWGLGAQMNLSPTFGLRAQWQRYETDEEVDVVSLGLLWKF
jgi:OOP family OmpA-OmpF porin